MLIPQYGQVFARILTLIAYACTSLKLSVTAIFFELGKQDNNDSKTYKSYIVVKLNYLHCCQIICFACMINFIFITNHFTCRPSYFEYECKVISRTLYTVVIDLLFWNRTVYVLLPCIGNYLVLTASTRSV